MPPTLRTERTVLRPWRETDKQPFADMNADPDVMRHFPATLTQAESDQMLERVHWLFRTYGFGLWALDVSETSSFAGFVGLAPVSFAASFAPAVEIGWRLAPSFWNKGYATEAAGEVLRYGFTEKALEEVVSFTIPANRPSQRVMEKLGMRRDGTFEHPRLAYGHPMRTHMLYRISRSDWEP